MTNVSRGEASEADRLRPAPQRRRERPDDPQLAVVRTQQAGHDRRESLVARAVEEGRQRLHLGRPEGCVGVQQQHVDSGPGENQPQRSVHPCCEAGVDARIDVQATPARDDGRDGRGARIVDDYRRQLRSETVQALLELLRHAEGDDDDVDRAGHVRAVRTSPR